jgi:hypothetical protein
MGSDTSRIDESATQSCPYCPDKRLIADENVRKLPS